MHGLCFRSARRRDRVPTAFAVAPTRDPIAERLENTMKNHAKIITTTLVMALALTVGACGDSTGSGESASSPGGASSTTAANITFRTDPTDVEVWIDGKQAGTTPVVIAVEAGAHDVEFKRDGFEPIQERLEIEAGKDLTVTTALAVTGEPEQRVKTLLAALGIPEHENLEPKAHRGSTPPVMLYWPKRNVRRDGVGTWRIEIADYDDDGFLVFKKGRTELHRVPFTAEAQVMEGKLPAPVMEELKRGSTITWGIDFESKRKKDVMTTFTVKDGRALDRKLQKLKKRSVYRRAGPLEKQIAQIELKRNYRFYTEALTDAMSVLNTWPDTELADKIIADSLQRLKLKDSLLYTEIMKRMRGSGNAPRNGGLGPVARRLPPTLVAPKVKLPTSTGSAAGSGGMQAGGVGVKPTGADQKRQPGPIAPDGTHAGGATGVPVDPAKAREQALQARRAEVEALRSALDAATQAAEELEAAEKSVMEADQAVAAATDAVKNASDAVEQARSELETARSNGASEAELQAKQQALDAAEAARATAQEQAQDAQEAREKVLQQATETMEKHSAYGSSREASEAARELQEQVEEKSQPLPHEETLPHEAVPAPDDVDEDPLADPREPSADEALALQREALQESLESSQGEVERANQWFESSGTAVQTSQQAYEAAQQEMDAAEASGDAARIEAAERALAEADETYQRNLMDHERAAAEKERAAEELEMRRKAIEDFEKDPSQGDPAGRNR